MNLYIETEDGAVKNHPAFEENLMQAFGRIPEHWEPFVRVERPILTPYQVLGSEKPVYRKINGTWTDIWDLREMSAEEKAAKQKELRDAFFSQDQAENWSAWALDEATCEMVPPIPPPDPVEGRIVFWCGADANWKEAPARPIDDNQYKFDFLAWEWVKVAN